MDEKKRVMIVDDEEGIRRMVKLVLEETGVYEVKPVSNPKEIVNEVRLFKPDVILLDMLMPGIGGIEVCEMLNRDTLGRTIPIIVISALDKDKEKLMAYKLGVVDFLVKPVEKNAIISAIEKALRFK